MSKPPDWREPESREAAAQRIVELTVEIRELESLLSVRAKERSGPRPQALAYWRWRDKTVVEMNRKRVHLTLLKQWLRENKEKPVAAFKTTGDELRKTYYHAMGQLFDYTRELEQRVRELETENAELKAAKGDAIAF